MNFELEALDAWTDDVPYEVTAESVNAYAAATNDTSPRYAEVGIAPPVFAVLPMWPTLLAARDKVVPEEARPNVLHGSQDIHITTPLRVGDSVASRAKVIGVHPKSSGTVVTIFTRTAAGAEVRNEQYVTLFYRGIESEEKEGELAPGHRLEPDVVLAEQAEFVVDADQTLRYADASTDRNPIHLDAEFARSKGLPGIIVHGLCSMAMSGAALIDALDLKEVERVSRLAVKFSRPVIPDQKLRVDYAQLGSGPDAYGFRVEDAGGQKVFDDGRLEVS